MNDLISRLGTNAGLGRILIAWRELKDVMRARQAKTWAAVSTDTDSEAGAARRKRKLRKAPHFMPSALSRKSTSDRWENFASKDEQPAVSVVCSAFFQQETAEGNPVVRLDPASSIAQGQRLYTNSSW